MERGAIIGAAGCGQIPTIAAGGHTGGGAKSGGGPVARLSNRPSFQEFSHEFTRVWDFAIEMLKPSNPINIRIFLLIGFGL